MNKYIIYLLVLQVIICVAMSLHGVEWHEENNESSFFAPSKDPDFEYHGSLKAHIVTTFMYLQLLNTLIPISLYVTIEVMKIVQSSFIRNDANLLSRKREGRQAQVKNAGIIEELGQVSYVFTDKTGTLTNNEMKFKTACIGLRDFGPLNRNKKTTRRNSTFTTNFNAKQVAADEEFDYDEFNEQLSVEK